MSDTHLEKSTLSFPFTHSLFDSRVTDGNHIQNLLVHDLKLSLTTRLFHHRVQNGDLYSQIIEGRDVDIVARCQLSPDYEHVPDLEVFLVPMQQRVINLTQPTLLSLFDAADIPPKFIQTLADNNGICTSSFCNYLSRRSENIFSIHVKLPLGAYTNGSFYFSYNARQKSVVACLFFSPKFDTKLGNLLKTLGTNNEEDPFLVLVLLLSQISQDLETDRSLLDLEVMKREAATGAGAHLHRTPKIPIEQYPPLFDKLHHTQHKLMYLECALAFHLRLVIFMQAQHRILAKLRLDEARGDRKVHDGIDAGAEIINFTLDHLHSQAENTLEQCKT